MNKLKTAILSSALLVAFGTVHAQSAGEGAGSKDAAGRPSSEQMRPSTGADGEKTTADAVSGSGSSSSTSSGASDTSSSSGSMSSDTSSSGASGSTGSTSAGSTGTAGGAQGLDNSASPSAGVPSPSDTNSTTKGDAMRPKDTAAGATK